MGLQSSQKLLLTSAANKNYFANWEIRKKRFLKNVWKYFDCFNFSGSLRNKKQAKNVCYDKKILICPVKTD